MFSRLCTGNYSCTVVWSFYLTDLMICLTSSNSTTVIQSIDIILINAYLDIGLRLKCSGEF